MSHRSISWFSVACVIFWLAPLGLAGDAEAAECWGGTLRRVLIANTSMRYVGTVTYPGASHETLIQAPDGFSLSLVDADDPSQVLVDIQVPAERFISTARKTSYDGAGEVNDEDFDAVVKAPSGVGKALLRHALRTARENGALGLEVASDPHAEGFYRKLGARRIGVVPSHPEGRKLPLLRIPADAVDRV